MMNQIPIINISTNALVTTPHKAKSCISTPIKSETRKPKPINAMSDLITQVRQDFPFTLPEAQICAGKCVGCPKKLLELADTELSEWESRLERGETPLLGDISRLGKLCKNIRRGLVKNSLVH
jgi:hypothetical protein